MQPEFWYKEQTTIAYKEYKLTILGENLFN